MIRRLKLRFLVWKRRFEPTPLAKVALLIGVGAHVAGFLLFQVVTETKQGPVAPESWLFYTAYDGDKWDPQIAEHADLFDTEPLYLPTSRNASPRLIPQTAWARQDSSPFLPFTPSVVLDDHAPDLDEWLVSRSIPWPVDDPLPLQPTELLQEFGRTEQEVEGLAPRLAQVTVTNQYSGRVVLEAELPPPGEWTTAQATLWDTAIFMVLVEAEGRVGQPLLLQSTGIESLDRELNQGILQSRLLSRLPAGYHRVEVGP